MKNREKLVKLLYLFIILSPIIDMLSGKFYIDGFSITMLLRPIIPIYLLIFIFIKDKYERKKMLIITLIYIIYGFIHLFLYSKNIMPFAYGNTAYEASYIINYTYLMFTFYLFIYTFKNTKKNHLYLYLYIYNLIYIGSIYISILTNTSNSTYSEGIGYIGWFNTGGAIGSILALSLMLLFPKIFENKENVLIKFIYIISVYIYLIFLLGTRVGLYVSILTIIIFILSNIFISLVKQIKISKKTIVITSVILIVLSGTIYMFGSMSKNRREFLNEITGKNPVDETAETIYMAYDLILLKKNIDNNEISENYMTKEQINALNKLDKYTRENKYKNTNLRGQQFLYHYYLYENQKDINLKLFGNGYLSNMGILTLEMETIALLFNFGIVGFILFFLPFLSIFIYGVFIVIKNVKKINIEFLMILGASFLSMSISFYSGHTYFNTSVMLIVIIVHTFLIIEIEKIRGKK